MLAKPTTHDPVPDDDPPVLTAVARLNDALRCDGVGGMLLLSAGVVRLGHETLATILDAVRAYDDFTGTNDPAGDHDRGMVTWAGEWFVWQVAVVQLDRCPGALDPADTPIAVRVLSVSLDGES